MQDTKEYHLFYGKESPFSQFHPAIISGRSRIIKDPSPGEKKFPTSEHWMHYYKAVLFGDRENADKILRAKTPKEAKDIGRNVTGFNEDIWRQHRFSIVLEGNIYKFTQNPSLKNQMMDVKAKHFVEASPTDSIWGIGNDGSLPPDQWKGFNLLGKALDATYLYILTHS